MKKNQESGRLDPDEERCLGLIIQLGLQARQTLQQSPSGLSAECQKRLERRVALGYQAESALVAANRPLAVMLARRLAARYGMPPAELEGPALEGLLVAARTFDPSRQTRYSTMAAHWVRQKVSRFAQSARETIRRPAYQWEHAGKVSRISAELTQKLGRVPTEQELSEHTGLNAESLSTLRPVRVESLDAPMRGDEVGESAHEHIAGEGDTPEDAAMRASTISEVQAAVATLAPVARLLIQKRWGLSDGELWTLHQCAIELQMPLGEVAALEQEALAQLRQKLAGVA